MTKEDINALIEKEMEPMRVKFNKMKDNYDGLKNKNIKLEKTLLESKKGWADKEDEYEKQITTLTDMVSKLSERNEILLNEAKQISNKAKHTVEVLKESLEQDKKNFIEKSSEKIEKYINNITSSAYRSAKVLFEQDFKAVETDLLKDLGKLLAPYTSDANSLTKLTKLRKALEETTQEKELVSAKYSKNIKLMTEQNKELKKKLNKLSKKLEVEKLNSYRESLINRLPSDAKERARKIMSEYETFSDLRRIYKRVIKESSSGIITTPVEVSEKSKEDKPNILKETGLVDINDAKLLERSNQH